MAQKRHFFWRGGIVLLLGAVTIFSLLGTPGLAHAQSHVVGPSHLPCTMNACDLVDPEGRCDQADPGGGCLSSYPKDGAYTPAPGTCQVLGSRLAVLYPQEHPIVLKNLTIDAGEAIGLVRLLYSDPCGTNWLDVIFQGRCKPHQGALSPCSASGYLHRTANNTQDGDSSSAFFLPGIPSGTTHTTMLYAADVPVQGCVSITYPHGSAHIGSPSLCITQAGF